MPNLLRSLAVLSLCASAAYAQDNKWSDDVLCKRGKADACARAGREAIDQGQEGDEKAYARAKPLLEQGCKGNAPAACDDLGWIYDDGLGIKADKTKAVHFYTKACDGGLARGCTNLGECQKACPKGISIDFIARMNRDYVKAALTS